MNKFFAFLIVVTLLIFAAGCTPTPVPEPPEPPTPPSPNWNREYTVALDNVNTGTMRLDVEDLGFSEDIMALKIDVDGVANATFISGTSEDFDSSYGDGYYLVTATNTSNDTIMLKAVTSVSFNTHTINGTLTYNEITYTLEGTKTYD